MKSEMPEKRGLRRRLTEALELPKEVALPKLIMVGNESIVIQNYKKINEYKDDLIIISTTQGIVRIEGEKLVVREITKEDVVVEGKTKTVEFSGIGG